MLKVLYVIPLLVLAGCGGSCGGSTDVPKANDYVCTDEELNRVERETGICVGIGGSTLMQNECFKNAKMAHCTPRHIEKAFKSLKDAKIDIN